MPDWLEDLSLSAPPPDDARPPSRREQRRQRRLAAADARARQGQARQLRLVQTRRDISPAAYLIGSILLLAVLYGAAVGLPALMNRPAEPAGQESPATSTPTALRPTPVPSSSQPSLTPPPSTTGRSLSGEKLARAWLTGFLTRTTRDDTAWEAAIADLTTPTALASLRGHGPDEIGLQKLSTWRVAKIAPITGIEADPDTTTRQTLSYAVTVTDGTHSAVKPFQIHAYRDGTDGRWLVGAVHQLYSSEG